MELANVLPTMPWRVMVADDSSWFIMVDDDGDVGDVGDASCDGQCCKLWLRKVLHVFGTSKRDLLKLLRTKQQLLLVGCHRW